MPKFKKDAVITSLKKGVGGIWASGRNQIKGIIWHTNMIATWNF